MSNLMSNMVLRDASASYNTLRDGGNTALYAADTVDNVETVDTVWKNPKEQQLFSWNVPLDRMGWVGWNDNTP